MQVKLVSISHKLGELMDKDLLKIPCVVCGGKSVEAEERCAAECQSGVARCAL